MKMQILFCSILFGCNYSLHITRNQYSDTFDKIGRCKHGSYQNGIKECSCNQQKIYYSNNGETPKCHPSKMSGCDDYKTIKNEETIKTQINFDSIKIIEIWNLNNATNTGMWTHTWSNTLQSLFTISSSNIIEIKTKHNFNGLLMKLNNTGSNQCVLVRFIGRRVYPLKQNLFQYNVKTTTKNNCSQSTLTRSMVPLTTKQMTSTVPLRTKQTTSTVLLRAKQTTSTVPLRTKQATNMAPLTTKQTTNTKERKTRYPSSTATNITRLKTTVTSLQVQAKPPIGIIVGTIITVLLITTLIILLAWFCRFRKNKKHIKEQQKELMNEDREEESISLEINSLHKTEEHTYAITQNLGETKFRKENIEPMPEYAQVQKHKHAPETNNADAMPEYAQVQKHKHAPETNNADAMPEYAQVQKHKHAPETNNVDAMPEYAQVQKHKHAPETNNADAMPEYAQVQKHKHAPETNNAHAMPEYAQVQKHE